MSAIYDQLSAVDCTMSRGLEAGAMKWENRGSGYRIPVQGPWRNSPLMPSSRALVVDRRETKGLRRLLGLWKLGRM